MNIINTINKKTLIGLLSLTISSSFFAATKPSIVEDPKMEAKIEDLLKKLTLEEKIGQMTQLALDVLGKGENVYVSDQPFVLDKAMLDTVFHKYKVGSILNTTSNIPLTVQQWAETIANIQKEAIKATGIPVVYGVDQIHGVTYTIDGTLFPQEIGMGATFNPNLVKEGAIATSYESRACNIPWTFSPTLDMGRDARWPRLWESYGEDAYLISEMGKAAVVGYQGTDPNKVVGNHIATCLKHYMGYGASFSGKDRTPSYIAENDLREKHFEPFLQAIHSGALSVMANSGMINGVPVHADKELLTKWLKEDLNWDGLVVTDWADINNLYIRDRVASSKKEAIKLAINAGIDMAMVPYEWSFCTYLKELVEEKAVPMYRIDDAVRRVLRMKFRLGLFERPFWSYKEYPKFGSQEYADLAQKSAEESITLLKNKEYFLPINKNSKVLIAGPNANSMRTLNGGWTLSWQGEKADFYGGKYNTIYEAFVNKAGTSNVLYEPGVTYKSNYPLTEGTYAEENTPEIEKAVAAAQNVDYIILALGENSYCETPGNLNDLTLSVNQLNLSKALAATGKPIILVLNEGRPRIISEIEPLMQSILQVYLPGNYGGDALANIIYGDVNPSGKLPYTYPKYPNSLITYDHKPSENIDKMQGAYDYDAVLSLQWRFGYGLSYTTFEYSNMTADRKNFSANDIIIFTVDVQNTGKIKGKESALLFSSDKVASITPDVRRLRSFDKIELNPGEKKTVQFLLSVNDLAFVNAKGNWTLEKGYFDIQIGSQVVNINCVETKIWDSALRN